MRYHHVEEHLSHNKCCFCVSVNNMIWALEDWFCQNEHLANPCNLRCHNTRTNYIIRVYDLAKPIEGLFYKQHFYEIVKNLFLNSIPFECVTCVGVIRVVIFHRRFHFGDWIIFCVAFTRCAYWRSQQNTSLNYYNNAVLQNRGKECYFFLNVRL